MLELGFIIHGGHMFDIGGSIIGKGIIVFSYCFRRVAIDWFFSNAWTEESV